jgi:hypothetical protein
VALLLTLRDGGARRKPRPDPPSANEWLAACHGSVHLMPGWLRKIAVFGGTAHPALAAEIFADLLTRQEPLGRGDADVLAG